MGGGNEKGCYGITWRCCCLASWGIICPGADDGNSEFPLSSWEKGSTFLLLPTGS